MVGAALIVLERARPRWLTLIGTLAGAFWAWPLLAEALQRLGGLRRLPSDLIGQSYAALVQDRAQGFVPYLGSVVSFDGFWLLALFCFGGALYRSGVLWWPQQHPRTLKLLLGFGWGLGLPLSALLAYLNTQASYSAELWGILARLIGGLALGLGYVGGLGLLSAAGKLGPLRYFAASGRLALSNYLTQSIIMTSVFYPYGLGLYGQWGAFKAVLLALGLGLAQVGVSNLYLRRFAVGPLEWTVRRLVYGRR